MFKLPRNPLLSRAAVIGVLVVLMLIPLGMIEGLIAERAARRMEAVASVQASFAGSQTLALPFFIWPYVEHWSEQSTDTNNRVRVTQVSEAKHLLIFADQTQAAADVVVHNDRYRGIHRVRTFESTITVDGQVTWPDRTTIRPAADRRVVWGEPRLVLPISDVRGLRGSPSLALQGDTIKFREGTQMPMLSAGLHAVVPTPADGITARYSITVHLAGTERLAFAPTAQASIVKVKSAWTDPHFGGSYLPSERTVTAAGFSAAWSVSALASDVQQQIRAIASATPADRSPRASRLDSFEVDFIEAVNTYLLAERSAKHGALIIVLVFAALFFFDTLRSLNAHPVQYGLVGLALVVFFLLLLSLSEHIAFGLAYLAAASACISLISYYISHVLADRSRAFAFGAGLALMYATIYSILIAEGTALLMGSVLLFVMLALAMIVTRRLDWRKMARAPQTGTHQ